MAHLLDLPMATMWTLIGDWPTQLFETTQAIFGWEARYSRLRSNKDYHTISDVVAQCAWNWATWGIFDKNL